MSLGTREQEERDASMADADAPLRCSCGGTLSCDGRSFRCSRCRTEFEDPVPCGMCGRIFERAAAVARDYCSAACADDADDASTVAA